MGCNLSRFTLGLSEESALSELPFFSEDSVENSYLPHRPPSVCEECWEGLFAIHFGLPLVSPRSGKWYRRWPEEISYSTSLTKLQSRADAGCAWCRLIYRLSQYWHASHHHETTGLTITLRGNSDQDSAQGQSLQTLIVEISPGRVRTDFFLYADREDPAAPYIRTRSHIRDVGSPGALALARQHLDDCIQRHEQCRKSSTSSPCLPTRLVDCADLARPRLVSTIGECGEYLALSYVWGGDQVHKTTIANLSTYEQGLAVDDLPPTIRDAIYVTHMLGFRWLWVDSLCIVQDSEKDKANEIGRMHHIYRYAHLTIMAGSANSVHEGFLQERPPPDIALDDGVALPFICPPCPTAVTDGGNRSAELPWLGTVFVAPIYSSITGREYSYELGRMATRAWCTQEYLMSPRALIFTPTTLLFRCLSTVQGVGSSFYQIRDDTRIPNSFFLPLVTPAAELDPQERRDVHITWMKVIEDYTRRTASDESDKLVACAAIAEQLHGILGSEYLAGLWRSDALLVHLLWRTGDKFEAKSRGCPHTRPAAYRSPSWSWAAIEGSIDHVFPKALSLGDPQTVALAEITECRVTLQDPTLRFGRVTDGVLVLRGTLLLCRGGSHKLTNSLLSVPLPSFEQARCQWQRGLDGVISDEEDNVCSTKPGYSAAVYMDCEVDELPGRMWLVPLVRTRPKHREEHVLHGLALELAPPSNGSGSTPQEYRFRRIGYFCDSVEVTRSDKDFTEHSLWHPLLQATKVGERPWTDIVVI